MGSEQRPLQAESAYMHALGNLFEHYFRRATTNRVHTCISCHAFDGALSHESHPAMEPQAGVHDLVNELATVSLPRAGQIPCLPTPVRTV